MAGVENFSVRMIYVQAKTKTNSNCNDLTFLTAEPILNCKIVSTEELKSLVGSELENDVENLKEDVLAVCLLTFRKVTMLQFTKLKEDINSRKAHYKFDRTRMGMFCNLKEGIEA